MAPAAGGLAIGIVASLGINRMLRFQLVRVSPCDAPTLGVAPLVDRGVTRGLPVAARAATNVEPATLRQD